MLRSIHPGIKIVISLAILIIVIFVGHEIIEARVFRELKNQPGVNIHIGSRSGNLLSGYTFRNFSVTQKISQDSDSPQTIYTPRMTVRWKFNPFELSEISWDAGTFSTESGDGDTEEIPVADGALLPDGLGWLTSEDEIKIGENDWDGSMALKVRVDLKELEGKIIIDRLPGRFIELMGNVPDGFPIPRHASVELDLAGSPERVNVTGRVSDPSTRQSFRF